MQSLLRLLQRHAAVLASLLAVAMCTAAGAYAEPSDSVDPPDQPDSSRTATHGPVTLTMGDLGASDTLTFDLAAGGYSVTANFQAPAGLTPAFLATTVQLPVTLRYASLTIAQGDRIVARQGLPVDGATPLVIPLNGIQAFGDWVALKFTMTAIPIDGYCWEPESPIRLADTSVTFTGTATPPTSIATFLPAVLRRATIAVPPTPTMAESDAAVQLAAVIARRYGGQNPDIVIAPAAGTGPTLDPGNALDRRIEIREQAESGLQLQSGPGFPTLLVSGPADQLTNQTRLLADDSLALAQSPKVVAGQIHIDAQYVPMTASLQQLDQFGPRSFTIDQTRFGHALSDVSIHLRGSYVPLPRDAGGQVTVSIDGTDIDRWDAEPSGTLDRLIDVPQRLLKRATEVTVGVSSSSRGGANGCKDNVPIDVRIDSQTLIKTATSGPPAPEGFQSFPQSLLPEITFGIGADAFADTVRAAAIAAGLQRSTGAPLTTSVTSLKKAIEAQRPAILIAAEGWTDASIKLPFSVEKSTVTVAARSTKDEPTTLTLDPRTGFGSIQTAYDGHRSLLIATSNAAPGALDGLLDWLAAERGRWSGLDGRALVTVPGADPVMIPNPPPAAEIPDEDKGNGFLDGWIPWVGAGVVALAALSASAVLLRIRRTKLSSPD